LQLSIATVKKISRCYSDYDKNTMLWDTVAKHKKKEMWVKFI